MEAEVARLTEAVLVLDPQGQVVAKVARPEGVGLHLHIHQSVGQATEALLVTDPDPSPALVEVRGLALDRELAKGS